jgi:hypothetical protein
MSRVLAKDSPKRKTLNARAAEIGIAVTALRSWQRCGCDVFDDQQVRDRLAKARKLPDGLKPEWMPSVPVEPVLSDDPTEFDIETTIRRLASTTDKHQAQTVKLQIDGLLNAYKLREAAGKYVPRSTVEEALIRVGSAVKAAIMRMEADLPPMLDGMDPPSMQRAIRGKVDEVMAVLSDESSKVWESDGTD